LHLRVVMLSRLLASLHAVSLDVASSGTFGKAMTDSSHHHLPALLVVGQNLLLGLLR
jgi:hypothetical protein